MLKKIKNNNRGAWTTWERGYMFIIIFCVFTFAIDVCILGLEIITSSHQLTYVSEKLSFQGGFIGSQSQFAHEWSNEDIYNYFKKSFERFGVNGRNYHWSLYVEEGGGTNKVVDTKSGAPLNLSYKSRGQYDTNELADNYATYSKLILGFEHKYFFSGKVFPFISAKNTYYLTSRYMNLYTNN